MTVKRIIGIDFGTSSSYLKVKRYVDGQPYGGDMVSAQYVEFNGSSMVPTLVQIYGDDVWGGYDAQVKKTPEAVIYRNFKMDLESADLAKREEAKRLTSLFFKFLYEAYSNQKPHFGDSSDNEETLVSYPAKWDSESIEFLASAAKEAGFPNVETIDEPTAALYTVLVQETDSVLKKGNLQPGIPAYTLMIDMGAGTTDLALCRFTLNEGSAIGGNITNQIICTWPSQKSELYFGGREFEEILSGYLLQYMKTMPEIPKLLIDNFRKQQLDNIKAWKENTVSDALGRGKSAAHCAFLSNMLQYCTTNLTPFPELTREKFERISADLMETFVGLIIGCLSRGQAEDSGFHGADSIDLVVLTGGHSQWYFVKDILNGKISSIGGKMLPRLGFVDDRIYSMSRPQETVSLGLIYSPLRLKVEKIKKSDEHISEDPKVTTATKVTPAPELMKTFGHFEYGWFKRKLYRTVTGAGTLPLLFPGIGLEQLSKKLDGLKLVGRELHLCVFSDSYLFLRCHGQEKDFIYRVSLADKDFKIECIYTAEESNEITAIGIYKDRLYFAECTGRDVESSKEEVPYKSYLASIDYDGVDHRIFTYINNYVIKKIIVMDEDLFFNVKNGWDYRILWGDINTEQTSEIKKFSTPVEFEWYYSENYIYYRYYNEIRKIKKDGSDDTELLYADDIKLWDMAGGKLLYSENECNGLEIITVDSLSKQIEDSFLRFREPGDFGKNETFYPKIIGNWAFYMSTDLKFKATANSIVNGMKNVFKSITYKDTCISYCANINGSQKFKLE